MITETSEIIKNTNISTALGEYIDAIYEISRVKPSVRTTDIALRLGISKPSVNRAVNTLKSKGYVTHEPYGAVALTDKGRAFGEYSGNKNLMIKKFLVRTLNMTDAEAEQEACLIGHSVSSTTVEKIRIYMEK